MRDVGILVWVGLLIIGVVSSVVSSLRRQTQSLPQRAAGAPQPQPSSPVPQPPPEWLGQVVAQMPPGARVVRVVRPPKAGAPAPAPPPSPAASALRERVTDNASAGLGQTPGHEATKGRRFFGGRSGLVRAVIAAEVLGKPRALSDEYFRG